MKRTEERERQMQSRRHRGGREKTRDGERRRGRETERGKREEKRGTL